MSSTTITQSVAKPKPFATGSESVRTRRLVPHPELAGLLVLAAVLNLWALSRNGLANEYYSGAVRSMASSWHNFLYASFDKAGVMTVDKPPLALWVQALSARVFGFSSWSMLVPQALMGVASVGLVYDMTRRRFGRFGGAAAGLVLATTPIAVAISRHNNPDALLVLCSTAALWFVVRGLEDGRTRWLVAAGACVGLGFETKMAAALLVVPALAAAWLYVAPRGRVGALRQLAAGGGVMAAVGLAWPVLVWLTPAADRPWVSGTTDNSVWSLMLGYNGLGRLDGQTGGPAGAGGPGGGGGGGGFFGGNTGVTRLLNDSIGGQAGWLLGFALVAIVALAVASRLRRLDPRTGWLIASAGAFATIAVAFSFAKGIFHPYYVSLLAPFTAALVGAGVAQFSRGGLQARIFAPAALAAGVVTELVVLHENTGQLTWLPPVLIAACAAGGLALAMPLVDRRLRAAILAATLGALLLAPATWAVDTLGHATSGTFPAGGPATTGFGGPGGGPGGGPPGGFRGGARGFAPPTALRANAPQGGPPAGFGSRAGGGPGGGGGFGGNNAALTKALAYAKAHGGGTVAIESQSGAAQLAAKGEDVAGIGGFSGRESSVSTAWLAQAVRDGRVRWVLTDGTGASNQARLPGDTRTGSSSAMTTVAKTCKAVSGVSGLYDCQGMASAIAAAG